MKINYITPHTDIVAFGFVLELKICVLVTCDHIVPPQLPVI